MSKHLKFNTKIPTDEEDTKNNSLYSIENKLDLTTASEKSNHFNLISLGNKNNNNLQIDNINLISNKKGQNELPLSHIINDIKKDNEINNIEEKIFGNNTSIAQPCKMGNIYCFFYVNGRPLCTIGSKLYLSILLIVLVNIGNFFGMFYIYNYCHYVFKIIGVCLFLAQSIFHFYTFIINQGIPDKKWFLSSEVINQISRDKTFNLNFNFEKFQVCKICNLLIKKDLGVVHCYFCNLCCEKYDHHCPWLGKCIGKNNTKSFNFFVLFTLIFFSYLIVLILFLVYKRL